VGAVSVAVEPALVETLPCDMTRERTWRLLIACARHAAGLASATEVDDVAAAIDDWTHAEHRAAAHGLVPWLARALSQGNSAPSD